ncbi:MAG: ABC transporter substrate-binding protein, partial [Gammaproteobacteria bacterium]|nr:ABC transporter substrate-binding protein [Gammaproteobacteria bacterium]
PLGVVARDNRTVPARSRQNLRDFSAIPNLVAVYCGRFSPTVIETIDDIHRLKLPLLDPWAAADIITEHHHVPSYTFRLSLRDSWAMPAIMRHARKKDIKAIGFLALNTSWGRGNEKALNSYLSQQKEGQWLVDSRWFFNLEKREGMLQRYMDLKRAGAHAIVLVANDVEASELIKGMASFPKEDRVPILAHWGITGGDFAGQCGEALKNVDLSVVQTYSFIGATRPQASRVIESAKQIMRVDSERKLLSPVGIAHAYDLTHILARAIDLSGSADRSKVRDALEQVRNYSGLIRDYPEPFTATRHDALSESDVFMSRYDTDHALVRVD